jgi:SHS2 domain-containing protein
METEFEVLDHTADVGIEAYGADDGKAFANAARGMFSLMVDLETVRETQHRDIEVTAPDQESLLVAWLSELLYLFDAQNLLFRRFDISLLAETGVRARAYGEPVDRSRHEIKIGVKAVTFHMLSIVRSDGTRVRVLFDI